MSGRAGVALALLLALPAAARAHRLHAEARLDEGQVLLEVYFSDGSPSVGAEVTVRRAAPEAGSQSVAPEAGRASIDEVLARGQTDARGAFRWRPPAPGRYGFEVLEPGLHRARVEVTVEAGAVSTRVREDLAADPAHPGSPAATASAGTAAGAPGAPARGAIPWGGVVSGLFVVALLAGLLAAAQRGMRGSRP